MSLKMFNVPSLARVTYFKEKAIETEFKLNRFEVVTLGLHFLAEAIERRHETLRLEALIRKVREETRHLKPNNGRFADHDFEEQTRRENGE